MKSNLYCEPSEHCASLTSELYDDYLFVEQGAALITALMQFK